MATATAAPVSATKRRHGIDDATECSICKEVYTDPRSLPCVHTFCFQCIEDYGKDKEPGEKLACPLCRQESVIPDGGIINIPKNFFVGKMLRLNELASPENATEKLCDLCSVDDDNDEDVQGTDALKKIATVFCYACQQNLCKSCGRTHGKLNNTRNHTVVDLSEASSGQGLCSIKCPSMVCDVHRDEPIKIYCFDCKTTMCTMCCIKEHNTHKNAEVAEVAGEFRKLISQDIEKIAATIDIFGRTAEVVKAKKASLFEQVTEAEKEICERADQLKTMIDEVKQKRIGELYEIQTSRVKQMDNLANEINQSSSLLSSLRKYSDELMTKGTENDVVRQADGLRRRSESLLSTEIIDNQWNALSVVNIVLSPSNLKVAAASIGDVIDKGAHPGTPTLLHSDQNSCGVTSIALSNDQLFVARKGEARVSIYNLTAFQLQLQLTFPGLGQTVYGLAYCTTAMCLYISDYDNRCIHKVGCSLLDATKLTKWNVADNPRALSINSANNLLVTLSKKVQEYTQSGKLVREISDTNDLWHAVEVRSGVLAVSRFGPVHGVFTVSMDGQVIHSYKGQQSTIGVVHMISPRCLAVDNHGYILVAEYKNKRIMVLNPTLTKAVQLPIPVSAKLSYVCALSLHQPHGRLYIGEGEGEGQLTSSVHSNSQLSSAGVKKMDDQYEQKRMLVFGNVTNICALMDTKTM